MDTTFKNLTHQAAQDAGAALAKLTGKRVDIKLTVDRVALVEDIPPWRDAAEPVVGVYLAVTGDAKGAALLIFPEDVALAVLGFLAKKKPETTAWLGELEESTLKEVGNIIVGAYLTSLSNASGVRLVEGVPQLHRDMFGAIMSQVVADRAQETEKALFIKVEMSFVQFSVTGHLVFFFGQEESELLFGLVESE